MPAPITTTFCTITKTTTYSSWVVPTGVKPIQDGGRLPSWKIENRPYLRNGSTNLHEIWRDDTYWASELERNLKFPTFKNRRWRTAAILNNEKSDIEQYLLMRRPVSVKSAIHRVGKSRVICYVIYFTYFT